MGHAHKCLATDCNEIQNRGIKDTTSARRKNEKSPPIPTREEAGITEFRLEGRCSIQLSYGRVDSLNVTGHRTR